MNSDDRVWCAKCCLRIAPYDLRTVYQRKDFHQQCFLKLVREEADDDKAKRSLFGSVRKGSRPAELRSNHG